MNRLELDKRALRQVVKETKTSVSVDERHIEQMMVMTHIESQMVWINAHTILMYHALPDELPTGGMIDRWQTLGKRVVLPRVAGETLEIADIACGLSTDNRYHILEPQGQPISPDEVELAIVPAVAVDPHGHRLGRGGGYYDRLLPLLHCPTVVAVMSCQVFDHVPFDDAHDCPVNAVVTRDGWINTDERLSPVECSKH